jgi:hypothetical protein
LQAAVVYSAALFTGIIVASVSSAGLLNPALALGLRSWGTVYVLGPLVGALVGVNLYYLLFAPLLATPAVAGVAAGSGRVGAGRGVTAAAATRKFAGRRGGRATATARRKK